MRVPYSDRSVRPCVRPVRKEWLSPFGATFTKVAPTVHLDMIY